MTEPRTTPRTDVRETVYAPPTDVYQFDDRIELHVDLPGVRPEDVEVTFEENTLTIRAERKGESENWLHREYEPAVFRRTFTVPEGFDTDAIAARFDHGVLVLRLPVASGSKARQIPVR